MDRRPVPASLTERRAVRFPAESSIPLADLWRVAGDGWTWEREVAMQLMGRCGLRADEVDYPGPTELRWSDDGDCWLFEVRGKNTKGGNPKVRDA